VAYRLVTAVLLSALTVVCLCCVGVDVVLEIVTAAVASQRLCARSSASRLTVISATLCYCYNCCKLFS
jgi:hypothetical protein